LRSGSAGFTGVIGLEEEGFKDGPFELQGELVSREMVTLGVTPAFGEEPAWKNLFNPTMVSVYQYYRPVAAAAYRISVNRDIRCVIGV
jgi:hypothetical protein